jgi:hypothetical protein
MESIVGWRWTAKSLTIEQENRAAFLTFSAHRPKSGSDQIVTLVIVNIYEVAIDEFSNEISDVVWQTVSGAAVAE